MIDSGLYDMPTQRRVRWSCGLTVQSNEGGQRIGTPWVRVTDDHSVEHTLGLAQRHLDGPSSAHKPRILTWRGFARGR